MQRMQKLQNFAAKIVIGNGRKYDRATPIIRKLKWLKIKEKCHLDLCVFTYKILKGHLPEWLLSLERIGNINPFRTRQQSDLVVPRTNSLTGDRNMKILLPQLWNKLPISIKDAPSIATFKEKIKDYLFSLNDAT